MKVAQNFLISTKKTEMAKVPSGWSKCLGIDLFQHMDIILQLGTWSYSKTKDKKLKLLKVPQVQNEGF